MKTTIQQITIVGALLFLLQGCAHTESTFSSSAPKVSLSDQVVERLISTGKILFDKDLKPFKADGHFYTVNFVSELARVNTPRADRLGCFSQAPDAITKYNAVPVSIFGIFNWEKRSNIVNALHSLHGGNHDAVLRRRATLQRLVRESYVQVRPDWQTGFLIHALGDSYAHVKGSFESSTAYGETVGHGFALQDPDNIYAGKNYKKYIAYVFALFDALSDPVNADGRARLMSFTQQLEAVVLEKKVHGKDLKDILAYETSSSSNKNTCHNLFHEIDDKEALEFLASLRMKLE